MGSVSRVGVQVRSASCSTAVQSLRANTKPSLIPSIWRKLPIDLLETVFTKLPISALKKFCRLSKRWKAFIRSEEFARRCLSVQLTAVCFDPYADNHSMPHLYTAVPSSKAGSWKKHYLKFIPKGELVDGLLAADQGLLCYRVRKKGKVGRPFGFEEIVLVVHNLLTGKWRRLIVPYTPETETGMKSVMYQNNMLVGLIVDKETGSYKLVVGFIDRQLTRKTFIYHSRSTSWTISAAVFPAMEQHVELTEWSIPRSICCAGEVYWLVEESDANMRLDDVYPHFKTMIKYSMKLDTWSVATQQQPCEEACHLHLASFENRLFMVNFDDDSGRSILFPEEFSTLVPDVEKFDAQGFRRIMNKAVYVNRSDEDYFKRSDFAPREAAAEGSAWFIHSEYDACPYINNLEVIYGFSRDSPRVVRLPSLDLDVFGFNRDSSRVIRIPSLDLDARMCSFLFASTLNASV